MILKKNRNAETYVFIFHGLLLCASSWTWRRRMPPVVAVPAKRLRNCVNVSTYLKSRFPASATAEDAIVRRSSISRREQLGVGHLNWLAVSGARDQS